jgi:hypothetical protein
LFAQLRQKASNAESLILTGHCYMVNGAVSELSRRKILGGKFVDKVTELLNKRCQSRFKDEQLAFALSEGALSNHSKRCKKRS